MNDITKKQATLEYITKQIDVWNSTATHKKHTITTWRRRMFVLVIIGTFLGLMSQWVSNYYAGGVDVYKIHSILAIASATAIALASYAGSQILTSDLEKTQIKSRAAAEALKVQGFLYLMGAAPYNRNSSDKIIYDRLESILKGVEDITPDFNLEKAPNPFLTTVLRILSLGLYKPYDPTRRWKHKFKSDMTFTEYFEERVKGQIEGYYLKKAANFQKIINRGNALCVIFGFLGVAVGTVAATTSTGGAMWIAFLSTASASIGSYIHANKYEFLMLSYVTTASQLELLSAKQQSMNNISPTAQRKFVSETETVFAMEHSAWISEVAGIKEEDLLEEEEAANLEMMRGHIQQGTGKIDLASLKEANSTASNSISTLEVNSESKEADKDVSDPGETTPAEQENFINDDGEEAMG